MKNLILILSMFAAWSCAGNRNLAGKQQVAGIQWQLIEVEGEAVVPGKAKIPYFLLDSNTGRVSGNGSCNGFGGNFTLSENNLLQFGPLISTKMYCDEMSVETKFFNALQKTHHYTKDDKQLILYNEKGEQLAKFQTLNSNPISQ